MAVVAWGSSGKDWQSSCTHISSASNSFSTHIKRTSVNNTSMITQLVPSLGASRLLLLLLPLLCVDLTTGVCTARAGQYRAWV